MPIKVNFEGVHFIHRGMVVADETAHGDEIEQQKSQVVLVVKVVETLPS